MKDFEVIPYKALTAVEKKNFAVIMANGNIVAKAFYNAVRKSPQKPERYTYRQFRKEVKESNGNEITLHGVVIPKKSVYEIMAVNDIEWPVLCGISNMISRIVNKCRKGNTFFGDLYNEAVAKAIEAIHGYDKTEIEFTTYAWHTIYRKVIAVANQKTLAGVNDEHYKLQKAFDATKMMMNCPATFDEVCDTMNMSEKDRRILEMSSRKVFGQSDMSWDDDEEHDYTVLSTTINDDWKPIIDHMDYSEIIKDIKLSDLEKTVLNAFLTSSSKNGWKTTVADSIVNPRTGKKYTRAAPALILRRVLKKIRKAMIPAVAA